MSGKNFSCNNATGLRKKSDFYETPYSMTRQMMERIKLSETAKILEPACGNGAISKVLKERYLDVTAYDIETNFFSEARAFDAVITNPPFSLALEFIEKAKTVADNTVLLLPLSYLHGVERFHKVYLDRSYPLRKVYVFTRYPMLGDPLREDGKYRTGMMVYAWFWFSKDWKKEAEISWINNQEFVL